MIESSFYKHTQKEKEKIKRKGLVGEIIMRFLSQLITLQNVIKDMKNLVGMVTYKTPLILARQQTNLN